MVSRVSHDIETCFWLLATLYIPPVADYSIIDFMATFELFAPVHAIVPES